MEVWNLVFTQYHQSEVKKIKELPTKNIDTGMGLERLSMIMQKKKNIFDSDLYKPIIESVLLDKNFGTVNDYDDTVRSRIVADHLKGAVQLLADGVVFSNKEQGYVLRRIFRRALDQFIHPHFALEPIIDSIFSINYSHNNNLARRKSHIIEVIQIELAGYQKILETDVAEIVQKIKQVKGQSAEKSGEPSSRHLGPEEVFTLYSSYGLSRERIKREGFTFDEKAFEESLVKHQTISKAGAVSKFGGHGLNSSEVSDEQKIIMTKYHTATHLLHQALRAILGPDVKQQGSDITPDRLRFDFSYPEKLTDDQKIRVENLVNEKIKENLKVTSTEMTFDDAVKSGALAFFKEKYPEQVTVYSIGDFSKEVCGGPHVKEIGGLGTFKIISEKSSSAGIRRIKAVLT
jgi:alanyl-tRNA synthetase